MRSFRSRLIWFPVFAALIVSGCANPPERTDPWRPVFKDALDQAKTDFEREVLEDFTITREEYEEAYDRLVQCITDAGISAEIVEQDELLGVTTSGSGTDVVYYQCIKGTTNFVGRIYNDMTLNPDLRNFEELVVECLIGENLIDSSSTVDDLHEIMGEADSSTMTDEMAPCLKNPAAVSPSGT